MPASPISRALETLVGTWISPLAALLRLAAGLALVAVIAASLLRALLAAAAWKYGWERRIVVRCPRCGRIAVAPEAPVCPQGHAVRFPPGTGLAGGPGSGPRRAAGRAFALAVPIATGLLAVWGFVEIRPWHLRMSLAVIFASSSFLFFAAALSSASWAVGSGPRGVLGRALHLALAGLLLLPAGAALALAELVEPPPRTVLGSVWRTPAATYLATARRRGRRVGSSAGRLEASVVEARVPVLGVVWQGLEALRIDGRDVPWKGSGGFLARRLAAWAGPLSEHGVWLSKSQRAVALPENARLWIVEERRRIAFLTEESLGIPEIPAGPSGRGPPL